jgi:hypothetical protein
VDRRCARVHGGPRAVRIGGGAGPGSSPTVAREDEEDEAVPRGAHPSTGGCGEAA